jgi:hypothetical protein
MSVISRVLLSTFAVAGVVLLATRPLFGRGTLETRLERITRIVCAVGTFGVVPFVWLTTDTSLLHTRIWIYVWIAGVLLFIVAAELRRRERARIGSRG